jgi:hypothetical protein
MRTEKEILDEINRIETEIAIGVITALANARIEGLEWVLEKTTEGQVEDIRRMKNEISERNNEIRDLTLDLRDYQNRERRR